MPTAVRRWPAATTRLIHNPAFSTPAAPDPLSTARSATASRMPPASLALPARLALLALAPLAASADMRSAVFAAIVARSGVTSNCSAFSSMFAADGVYESPVGSGWKVGAVSVIGASSCVCGSTDSMGRSCLEDAVEFGRTVG